MDDRDAYEPDDPKHPDFEDVAADRADQERKREREDRPMTTDTTIVAELQRVFDEVDAQRNKSARAGDGAAAREFAIAATALEDAIMRVNRGFAKRAKTFKIADVQRGVA